MEFDLPNIFRQFAIDASFASAEPYGSGHINDTFLVRTKEVDKLDYIFQRINQNVFKDIPGLMENIGRVTQHIRKKLLAVPGSNPDRETLTLVHTKDAAPFYYDAEHDHYWRVYIYINDTNTYDVVDTVEKAYEGGRAFGQFQHYLADLPGGPLNETIKDFHNIAKRLDAFEDALAADECGRAKAVAEEVAFVRENAESMQMVLRLGQAGKIPLRVTHNDTKFNNVLLDKNDKGLCVIDLDTVMPGYVHYDFSDALRIATNTAAEDEADLSKVNMNLELFKGFAAGFLSETKATLTQTEKESLPESVKLLPFMIGLRFLTDYLDGDNYFKIHFPGHNLQRARTQFQLARSMMQLMPEIKTTIEAILND